MRHLIIILVCVIGTCLSYNCSVGQTLFAPERMIQDPADFPDHPIEIDAVDIDGDGDQDALVLSVEDDKISWFENDGDGNFSTQQVISTEFNASQLLVEDMDGDDDPDLVVRASNNLILFRNNGSGNFSNELIASGSGIDIIEVAAGDIDGDGDKDLLFIDWIYIIPGSTDFYAILNDGSGSFGSYNLVYSFTGYCRNLYTADVENDGDEDILIASSTNGEDNKLAWLENSGGGAFIAEHLISDHEGTPNSIRPGDFNGDDLLDVVGTYHQSQEVIWYAGDGTGNFGPGNLVTDMISQPALSRPVDIDADNDLDIIVVVESGTGHISLYENDGSGTFGERIPVVLQHFSGASDADASDLDGDGHIDVMAVASGSDRVVWIENNGDGSFSTTPFPISRKVYNPSSLAGADLDGDGDMDLVAGSSFNGMLGWYENDGSENFNRLKIIQLENFSIGSIHGADLDNDNDQDLVYYYVTIYTPKRLVRIRNDGAGNFDEEEQFHGFQTNATSVTSSDIDDDGWLDIIYAAKGNDRVYWQENRGDWNFEDQLLGVEALDVSSVVPADLDRDGDLDVLSASPGDSTLQWFEQTSSGNFNDGKVINQDYPFSYVSAGDMDADTDIDVVFHVPSEYLIGWVENTGTQEFETINYLDASADSMDKVIAIDLDLDNDVDIVAASTAKEQIAWYENDGYGNFSAKQVINPFAEDIYTLITTDLDSDGDPDIVMSNRSDNKISWSENLAGEDLTVIRGSIYIDWENDGQFNNDDMAMSGIQMKVEPGGTTFYSDEYGHFIAYSRDPGSFTLGFEVPAFYDCLGQLPLIVADPAEFPLSLTFSAGQEFQQEFRLIAPQRCKSVGGHIFYDNNVNGMDDDGLNVGGLRVSTNGYGQAFSGLNGNYGIDVPINADLTVSTHLDENPSNGYCNLDFSILQTFPADNADYSISPVTEDVDTLDFGVVFTQPALSFDAGIYNLRVNHGDEPGKRFYAWCDYKIINPNPVACTLRIHHDPAVELKESSRPVANATNTYAEWIYPPGTGTFTDCMSMLWAVDSLTIEGDTLFWMAEFDCGPGGDACEANDTYSKFLIVQHGSGGRLSDEAAVMFSERNDGPMPEILTQDDNVLNYIIEFQNPLLVNAYDVMIVDTLPDELDWSTISNPFSSYPWYDFRITEDGVLIWHLEGIDLRSPETDELRSYGFVQFNVSLQEDLTPGTIIPNIATVYFNGIEPTETNEVIHRLVSDPVAVQPLLLDHLHVSIYPNPFKQRAVFEINGDVDYKYDLIMFDVLGHEVRSYLNLSENRVSIQKEDLPAGIYLLTMYMEGTSKDDRASRSWKLVVN